MATKCLLFLFAWLHGVVFAGAQTAPVTIVFNLRTPTWPTGLNADIVVTNNGATVIEGWTVAFDLPNNFSNSWNAVEGASTATRKIFSNVAMNATIRPGASRSFGLTPVTLLRETMDTFPTGPKTDAQWKPLWPGTEWANDPDEGRLAVDDQVAYGGNGKSVRVLYPQGGQQSGGSGAQWFIDIGGGYEDLYMSYWVRFDPRFDFVLGGKLPGLGGGVSFADRTHEWSGRLMWRENGKVEFYVHVPAGNEYDPGDRFWWNTEGFQAQFIPGRWHHIEIHMRLNTPRQFDGLMDGWFDGVKAAHYPAFYFRDAPTAPMKIAWVFFSTFFGGSSSDIWQARKDEHANFDHFTVSNSRIGYPGLPTDVDADKLPNAWERLHFGSDSAAEAQADNDGDGHSNLDAYIAGTLPLSGTDRFASNVSQEAGGGILRIEAAGIAGRNYKLQRSSDLVDWTDVEEIGPLAADQPLLFSPSPAPDSVFFRLVVSLSVNSIQ